jgi:hypothetical protein
MTLPQPDRCDWCRAWTCTERPLAEQLAILVRVREDDYDLRSFHKIAKRNNPSHEDVLLWMQRYWVERS